MAGPTRFPCSKPATRDWHFFVAEPHWFASVAPRCTLSPVFNAKRRPRRECGRGVFSISRGAAMRTVGPLLHVEDLCGEQYQISVLRGPDGLHGKWTCDVCDGGDDHARVHPCLDECLAAIRRDVGR